MSESANVTLDFIYIGAPRSASSWLYECLREHPDICPSAHKEISPFTEDGEIASDKLERAFETCKSGTVKGVMPPAFMLESRNAEFLSEHFPHIKIIAVLRDPVEKAYSYYQLDQSIGRLPADMSFETAVHEYPKYFRSGLYYELLKPFFDRFPREQIYVGIYDDLKSDPLHFVQSVYRFLDVDATIVPPTADTQLNISVTKGVRSRMIHGVLSVALHTARHLKRWSVTRRFVTIMSRIGGKKTLNRVRRWNVLQPRDKIGERSRSPRIDPVRHNELTKRYLPDVERLEQLIGRNLHSWKQ